MRYSKILITHFTNPRNNGQLKEYNAYAKGYNPSDGDEIKVFIQIENNRIKDISYLIKGCPRAIASASYTTEIVKGKDIKEVLNMEESSIREGLELIDERFDCIPLPLRTIKKAIVDNTKSQP